MRNLSIIKWFPLVGEFGDLSLFLCSLECISQKSAGSVSSKPSTVIEEVKTKRTSASHEMDLKMDSSHQDEDSSSASNNLKVLASFDLDICDRIQCFSLF